MTSAQRIEEQEPEQAVIFVPAGPEAARWERVCRDYCERMAYRVVSIVRWRPRSSWRDIRALAGRNAFDVLVTARRDHLPSRRRPRIEVIEEIVMPRRGSSSRRPRIIR